jgi:hypothetical protein
MSWFVGRFYAPISNTDQKDKSFKQSEESGKFQPD